MKSKYLLLAIGIFYSSTSFAQENVSVEDNLQQLKLSAIVPSLEYSLEKKISDKSVFEFKGGIGLGLEFSSSYIAVNDNKDYFNKYSAYSLYPIVQFGYKNYYNLNKRFSKGKIISNNSGNFFGVSLIAIPGSYVFEKYSDQFYTNGIAIKNKYYDKSFVLQLTPKWGINRNLNDKFSYNLDLGPTLGTDFDDVAYGLYLQTGFSYKF